MIKMGIKYFYHILKLINEKNMKKEIRIYIVDVNMHEFDTSPATWSDEKFISEAEIQGNVYTLKSFEKNWNNENVVVDSFIRFIEIDNVEDFTPHLITINKIELASNLAHKSVIDELIIPFQTDGSYSLYENEDDLFIEDEDEILTYKDDVQDVFNKWYDYYLNMIEESGE